MTAAEIRARIKELGDALDRGLLTAGERDWAVQEMGRYEMMLICRAEGTM